MGHHYVLVQVSIFRDVLEMSTPNITGTCNPPPFRMDFSRIDETAAEIVPWNASWGTNLDNKKGHAWKDLYFVGPNKHFFVIRFLNFDRIRDEWKSDDHKMLIFALAFVQCSRIIVMNNDMEITLIPDFSFIRSS